MRDVFSQITIHATGSTASLPSEYTSIAATHVAVLLPGLWDAHVHLFGCTTYTVDAMATTSPIVAGARSARDLAATLNAGYTSVREMAGYGVELGQVVDEGWLPGPSIYSCVAILSPTAGHADPRILSESHAKEAMECSAGLPLMTCDGEAESLKAVRSMIRRHVTMPHLASRSSTDEAFKRS